MINQSIILVRLLALILIWLGYILLLRNLVLSFESFNPSYLLHYFRQELLSPLLLLASGYWMRMRAVKIAAQLEKPVGK